MSKFTKGLGIVVFALVINIGAAAAAGDVSFPHGVGNGRSKRHAAASPREAARSRTASSTRAGRR
jgi:hypothetical protein